MKYLLSYDHDIPPYCIDRSQCNGKHHFYINCPYSKNATEEEYIAKWDQYLDHLQLKQDCEWDNVMKMQSEKWELTFPAQYLALHQRTCSHEQPTHTYTSAKVGLLYHPSAHAMQARVVYRNASTHVAPLAKSCHAQGRYKHSPLLLVAWLLAKVS